MQYYISILKSWEMSHKDGYTNVRILMKIWLLMLKLYEVSYSSNNYQSFLFIIIMLIRKVLIFIKIITSTNLEVDCPIF